MSAWLAFREPRDIITATIPAEVLPALLQVEAAVQDGFAVAGYCTYEAAPGLDAALQVHALGSLPLLKFGVYTKPACLEALPFPHADCTRNPVDRRAPWARPAGPSYRTPDLLHPLSLEDSNDSFSVQGWEPSLTLTEYTERIERIKQWIASGDTYQVNFTMRLLGHFSGSPVGWFQQLLRSQRPRYAAYIEDDTDVFCSASPELFFRLDGDEIECRPMKGTSRRGRTDAEDQEMAVRLAESVKDRAENLMIVDMMRNDLGRIAETGSVVTGPMFCVERYPTLWQMTSTVRARTQAGFAEILQALFPCCSITGAPKARTMEIIRELEDGPRGIYTGTIGCLLPRHPLTGDPGRFGSFSVAIRTPHIRKESGQVDYGTGGGVVWDSVAEQEHRECRTKALILTQPVEEFDLFETLLWRPDIGWFLLQEHEERLAASARYFDYPFDAAQWRAVLNAAIVELPHMRHRVRTTLSAAGEVKVQCVPLRRGRTVWRVEMAHEPVQRENVYLYHKTTHRAVYDQFRASHPGADDVILWNEDGQVTESCLANVVVQLDGRWWTPPVECGLLNGTLRRALIRRGRIAERILTRADVKRADRVLLINSVRGAIEGQ